MYKTRERKGYNRGTARNFLHSFPLSGTPVVQSYWAWMISRKFQGIWWNLGDFGEIQEFLGKLRGIQWNSVALNRLYGAWYEFSGSSGKGGVWGGFGQFGASKGFCANGHPKLLLCAGRWAVAKLQGDKLASAYSRNVYDPWNSAPFRVSCNVL